jgi:putative addiction module CopG family antidote
MEVTLSEEQKAFVRLGVESGRYAAEEDPLRDALALWEERERRRAEINASIDLAEASYARGEGTLIASGEQGRALATRIKQRARARFLHEGAGG